MFNNIFFQNMIQTLESSNRIAQPEHVTVQMVQFS